MKIVYLIQGSLDDLIEIQHLIPNNQYLITLNYDKEPTDSGLKSDLHVYFPDSTWAQGRNLLLDKAIVTKIAFDYFVFVDADLRIVKGDFSLFERLLEIYRPKLGLPLGDQIKQSYRYQPKAKVQTQFSFDQILQAYRSDVVTEAICIPYVTDFDSQSWWYSCEINSYLSVLSCRDEVFQFNDFEILNSRHDGVELSKSGNSKYLAGVSKSGLAQCRVFIKENYVAPKLFIGTLFHPWYLPKLMNFPSLKQLIDRDFDHKNSISLRRVLKASTKTFQLVVFKFFFRRYYLEIRIVS